MSDDQEERDVWRSPDGRFRLVARVRDDPTSRDGLKTDYGAVTLDGGRWRVCDDGEASQVLGMVARQLDRDAREEQAR